MEGARIYCPPHAAKGSVPCAAACASRPTTPARSRERKVEAYEQLKKIIAECEDDMQKAVGGNKAAQTRVRKVMQDVKNMAQQIREQMLAIKKQGEGA